MLHPYVLHPSNIRHAIRAASIRAHHTCCMHTCCIHTCCIHRTSGMPSTAHQARHPPNIWHTIRATCSHAHHPSNCPFPAGWRGRWMPALAWHLPPSPVAGLQAGGLCRGPRPASGPRHPAGRCACVGACVLLCLSCVAAQG